MWFGILVVQSFKRTRHEYVVAPSRSVVRLAAILSLLSAIALPLAQAQVSFLQPLTFPGGPIDVDADFNKDRLDIATPGTLLLGNGDGTFQAAKITDVGASFGVIVVADVNGDGKPDVLGLGTGGQVFVFLANGDATFKTGVPYAAGPNPYIMLTGDFNGDGKLDIATAGPGSPGEIAVMLGNGNGTFQSPVTSTGVATPVGVAAGDLNGDGKLDLIVSDN